MLFEQIARNRRHTIWLLIFMAIIVLAVGLVFAWAFGTDWMWIFWLAGFGYLAWFYWHSATVLMKINGGRQIDEKSAPRLYELVTELCLASGLPLPKIYLLPIDCPNAFATGCDPEHASLAVTSGLLEMMNDEELRGVLGHELAHIKNYDIRVTTIAMSLLELVRYSGWGLLIAGLGLMSVKTRAGIIKLIFWMIGASLAVVGGLIAIVGIPLAKIAFFAISREREYLADAGSVEITRDPSGLIGALEKLKNDDHQMPTDDAATNAICFNAKQGNWLMKLFDTHPPLEKRITRLKDSAS
ncbi:MAG: M48 family metallopeptidase [Limosilactobacillus mucosae]